VSNRKSTPDRCAALIACMRTGNYANVAAKACGVSEQTLSEWRAEGRAEPGGRYGAFAAAMDEAEAEGETKRSPSRRMGGWREREATAQPMPHRFVNGACVHCAMGATWPGASDSCGMAKAAACQVRELARRRMMRRAKTAKQRRDEA
jgi:hypothetical protein